MNFYVVGTARSEHRSVLGLRSTSNRVLIVSALAALLLHWGATVWSPAAGVLGLVPLSATEWVACAVVGASAMAVPELHKLWRWRRAQRSRRSAPA